MNVAIQLFLRISALIV